jgi:hypothetical protein
VFSSVRQPGVDQLFHNHHHSPAAKHSQRILAQDAYKTKEKDMRGISTLLLTPFSIAPIYHYVIC